MFDVYTIDATTLIVFPLIVAAVLLILPVPREGLALIAVATQVLPFYWLLGTIIPDTPTDGTFAFETNKAWLTDLGVRYHVGIDGLSLVMVCLTVPRNDVRARLRGLGGPVPAGRTSRCCWCWSRP